MEPKGAVSRPGESAWEAPCLLPLKAGGWASLCQWHRGKKQKEFKSLMSSAPRWSGELPRTDTPRPRSGAAVALRWTIRVKIPHIQGQKNHSLVGTVEAETRLYSKGKGEAPARLWVKLLSRVLFFATPWTVAYQDPQSMGFSRQEYWSGLPFPSPGAHPNPGTEPRSPTLQVDALPSELPRKPVGGANLHLESNHLITRDAQRAQTNLCSPRPRDPTETKIELCLSVSYGGTGGQ